MEKEIEVKILNIPLEILEERLLKIKARFAGEELQNNIIFNLKGEAGLFFQSGLLRIRNLMREGNVIHSEITFKKKIQSDEFREHDEFTTEIKDYAEMIKILDCIGVEKVWSDRKLRRSYIFEGAKFDLDVFLDIENLYYMEIELKDKSELDRILKLLNIPKSCVSLLSAKEIQERRLIVQKSSLVDLNTAVD